MNEMPWPDPRTREDWRLRLALLKENAEYRQFWAENLDSIKTAYKEIDGYYSKLPNSGKNGLISGQFEDMENECEMAFKTLQKFESFLWFFCGIRPTWVDHVAVIEALEPLKDIPKKLPFVFKDLPAVVGLETHNNTPFETQHETPLNYAIENLKPSERLLRIDLSRKRGELMENFKTFLDTVEYLRKREPKQENYKKWNPDNSRYRGEAWQALEVWKMRRKKKDYPEISRVLNIKESTAKMAFSRAHILIEGRPYDPEAYKLQYAEIKKTDLPNPCETCPIRETCTELCPDVLAFVAQDEINQRELPIEILI